jgi:hypothetical protein
MFSNGLKHGKGKWNKNPYTGDPKQKFNNYVGEYEFDKKNGQGTFEWESGNVYRGTYLEDERHGYGKMYWLDGSIYKGAWSHGV